MSHPSCVPLYFLTWSVPLNLGLIDSARLAGQPAPGICLVLPPWSQRYKYMLPHLLSVRVRVHVHACASGALHPKHASVTKGCGPGGKNSGRFLAERLVTCAAGLVKGNRLAIQPMLMVCILESMIQSHSSSYISLLPSAKLRIRYSLLLGLFPSTTMKFCAVLYGFHPPGPSEL